MEVIWYYNLTNKHDDILYEFNVFHTGSEIIEASIKDIIGDGLKDIYILAAFVILKLNM